MRTEQYERTDWIGAAPSECLAVLRIQGFGYKQEPVEPVRKTQSRCHPKSHAWIAVADRSSNHRTQSESNPKRSTDEAERAGAFFFRCDIGDVGERRRDSRTGDP